MATCRYCGGAGGRNVNTEETCSKCKGFGRVFQHGADIYCSRCFGRGMITATIWERCSCEQKGGCFPAGTMVMTPFGQTEVSSLRAGDEVRVYDAIRRTFLEREVLKVLRYNRRRTSCLILANGTRLRLTPNHNVLVAGRWVRASTIRPGASIQTVAHDRPCAAIENTKVSDVDDGDGDGDGGNSCDVVYNPVVAGSFSLIADGVITHNFDKYKRVKMMYWTCYKYLAFTGTSLSQQELTPKEVTSTQ